MNDDATIRRLEPVALWNHFCDLNAVPRPSKKEARVSQFMREFGQRLGLETLSDPVGNVLIRKPGSAGMEKAPPIVLQSHLDMVCQQNAGTNFDFDREGIRMLLKGDWIEAAGTTLGADNGIGVAAAMALLSSGEVQHPPLEALFTIDEETGMTGAKQLPNDWLRGRTMLNLDTEDDTELTIGCAGGIDVSASGHCAADPVPTGWSTAAIVIRGLAGGHSGMDIHLGRGNANKLMNRLLDVLDDEHGVRLCSLDGGGLRNAIPRESRAVVALPPGMDARQLAAGVEELAAAIRAEYSLTDPGLAIAVEADVKADSVVAEAFQRQLVATIDGVASGIWRMSPSIPGLVQTSNNLARVRVGAGQFELHNLTRSNVDSERDELARIIVSVLSQLGGQCETAGSYPGWQPQPDSGVVRVMKEVYQRLFSSAPHVAACHAGLECGIIGGHYPGMEMVSFGPNIRGAHSPDEKVQVSSVQKFWKYLTATLARLGEAR